MEVLETVEEDQVSKRPGIWQLAFPSILGNLSFNAVGVLQTKFIGEMGPQALAAVGAGQRVFFAMQAVLMAVSAGTMALVAMGGLGLLIISFARPLAQFFLGNEPLTIDYTVRFIYILGSTMPLLAVEFAIAGSLRGAGDTRYPLMATFAGLIVMRCGLATLFTTLGLPVTWVYGALIGDYLLKGVLLIRRFHDGRWRTLVITE